SGTRLRPPSEDGDIRPPAGPPARRAAPEAHQPGAAAVPAGVSPTFRGWWHAAVWPGPCGTSGGSSREQISVAYRQRGWNLHPEGGAIGLGTSPSRTI